MSAFNPPWTPVYAEKAGRIVWRCLDRHCSHPSHRRRLKRGDKPHPVLPIEIPGRPANEVASVVTEPTPGQVENLRREFGEDNLGEDI